jgi:hypothetical protein
MKVIQKGGATDFNTILTYLGVIFFIILLITVIVATVKG